MVVGLGGKSNNDYEDFPCDTAFTQVDITATNMHIQTRFINNTILGEYNFTAYYTSKYNNPRHV